MGVIKVKYNNEWVQIPTFVVNDSIDLSYYATKTDLASKQDTISDLANIRQGANLGATALQSIPDEYVTSDILDGYVTSDVLNSYVTNEYAQESLQVKLVPGANVTIVDNEDGTQTINTDSASPLLNEEYGIIVAKALDNGTISQEDYDKLYSFVYNSNNQACHCELYIPNNSIARIALIANDGTIVCYIKLPNDIYLGTISYTNALQINADLSVTSTAISSENIYTVPDGIKLHGTYTHTTNGDSYDNKITLQTTGDGTQYLANDGTYKTLDLDNADEVYISNGEAPTGNQEIWIDTSVEGIDGYILDDAPSDGSQYVRQDGNWSKVEVSSELENEEVALLLIDLINRDERTLTQDEADKISSICLENGKSYYALLKADDVSDGNYFATKIVTWVLSKSSKYITAYFNNHYYSYTGNYGAIVQIDLTNLSYVALGNYSYQQAITDADTGEKYLTFAQSTDDLDIAQLTLITEGDGNSFLSNSGEYKEIPSQSTFSDTSANFEPSATYTDFPYQSRIALEGVTANDFVEVVFGINEALSGNYAPVCLTENGYVTIYSKVSDTITIPTIIIHK